VPVRALRSSGLVKDNQFLIFQFPLALFGRDKQKSELTCLHSRSAGNLGSGRGHFARQPEIGDYKVYICLFKLSQGLSRIGR